MNTSFVVYGLAIVWGSIAFARGLPTMDDRARRLIGALLALHGVGSMVVGLFNLEAIVLHLAGFLLVVSPALTFPLISRRLRHLPGWRTASRGLRVAGTSTLVLTIFYFATFDPGARPARTAASAG